MAKRDHKTPSGRIQRRLPEDMRQAGLTAEAQQATGEPYKAPRSQKQEKPLKASKSPKQQKEKPPRRRGRVIVNILVGLLAVFALSFAVLAGALVFSTRDDGLWLDLEQVQYRGDSIIYYTDAATGEAVEYARLSSVQHSEYVSWGDIPQYLRDAFVAIEDQNFYSHGGIDVKRTAYAMLNETKRMLTGSYIGGDSGFKQGASTITQQLVKNLSNDDEASGLSGYWRKVREIWRAIRLDIQYDKDEILCAYLNTVGLTDNTSGVQAEAKKLFGKDVSQLSLAECASIAAITRNPTRYNPNRNPDTHIERRNYVLAQMLEQKLVSQEEYDAAVAEPLNLTGNSGSTYSQEMTSYFTDMVIDEVITNLAAEYSIDRGQASYLLYNCGLRIYTTLDYNLQTQMEGIMQNREFFSSGGYSAQQPVYDEDGNAVLDESGSPVLENVTIRPQAAMISLDYEGGVAAVVGGLGDKEYIRGFNRATSAVRQIGSTAKTIGPYVVGIENNKITWSSAFEDSPVRQVENEATGTLEDWPRNVTNSYANSNVLVADAFARSVNTIAVRVGDLVGYNRIYRFLTNDVGISTLVKDDIDAGPLALGGNTYGISPLEMAKAYAMFGNGGYVYETHTVTRVTNGGGTTLYRTQASGKQVIGEDTSYIMNRLMSGVMRGSGTASGKAVSGEMESVGKTGTTSDKRDHWFIGLTPYYVTAVWYGYDDNTTLQVDNSTHPPTMAWKALMERGQRGLEYKAFPTSDEVEQIQYCTVTGARAGANCPSATGYYKHGHGPDETCAQHG